MICFPEENKRQKSALMTSFSKLLLCQAWENSLSHNSRAKLQSLIQSYNQMCHLRCNVTTAGNISCGIWYDLIFLFSVDWQVYWSHFFLSSFISSELYDYNAWMPQDWWLSESKSEIIVFFERIVFQVCWTFFLLLSVVSCMHIEKLLTFLKWKVITKLGVFFNFWMSGWVDRSFLCHSLEKQFVV